LDVDRATLSAPLISSGPLADLMDILDRLAWDVALAGSSPPRRTREDFLAGRPKVPFEVVKLYGRALAARDPRVPVALLGRVLTAAPTFDAARVLLGRLLLAQREFSPAHRAPAPVGPASPPSPGARFV